MRKLALLLIAALGCISKGTDIPPLAAGSGVTVDPATNTVSIDTSKVPVLPTCAQGQLIARGAGNAWVCTDTAPNATNAVSANTANSAATATSADKVDDMHAADFLPATAAAGFLPTSAASGFLGATAQAADSAKLGGQPPTDYLRKGGTAVYTLDTELVTTDQPVTVTYRYCSLWNGPRCVRTTTNRISVNGTFCGATASATNGAFAATDPQTSAAVTGYRAGKVLCEAACANAAAAHVCTGEELARAAQLGRAVGGPVWFTNPLVDECNGWTDATTSHHAWTWPYTATPTSAATCDQVLPIACCL